MDLNTTLRTLFLAIAAASANVAFGWGVVGHEVVCEIAYRELAPRARREIDRLAKSETDARFRTFRRACVWPDRVDDGRRPEHYVNVPRQWSRIPRAACVEADRCIFTAIRADIEIVASDAHTDEQRWTAAKYLGHWIGDLHQPLHVSYGDDFGGNRIVVDDPDGECTNLHAVWDHCIPEGLMRSFGLDPRDGDDRVAFAIRLRERTNRSDSLDWTRSDVMVTWADESLELARSRPLGYCTLLDGVCRFAARSRHFERTARAELTLTEAYEKSARPTVERQLQKGGLRLAALLNRIFVADD